jgi:DNA-binding NarL/FixJ family response regulator
MALIRVLVCDDHHIFRMGLVRACESDAKIQVMGQACNGQEAVEMARRLKPDIVLMDINMPVMDGIQAARLVGMEMPKTGVIMLTVIRDDEHIFEAIKAGARGYILKDVDEADLIAAIHAVHRGEGLIDSAIAARVLAEFRRVSQTPSEEQAMEQLTAVEMEILRRLAEGNDNGAIARELKISEKTVVNRLSTIYQKLHVNNRTQAALYALRKGWANVKINL